MKEADEGAELEQIGWIADIKGQEITSSSRCHSDKQVERGNKKNSFKFVPSCCKPEERQKKELQRPQQRNDIVKLAIQFFHSRAVVAAAHCSSPIWLWEAKCRAADGANGCKERVRHRCLKPSCPETASQQGDGPMDRKLGGRLKRQWDRGGLRRQKTKAKDV